MREVHALGADTAKTYFKHLKTLRKMLRNLLTVGVFISFGVVGSDDRKDGMMPTSKCQ